VMKAFEIYNRCRGADRLRPIAGIANPENYDEEICEGCGMEIICKMLLEIIKERKAIDELALEQSEYDN